jgi:NAD(P)-dependent dehydrogenase (short-subunit alcohol dehydrogenase family)
MLEISYAETERIVRTNLLAASFIALGFVPLLQARGGGDIVNFTTLSVRDAFPLMSAFDSAKAGVEQLTRHIAHEFGGNGIHANAFALATLRTPDEINMKPQGDHAHWVDPNEVAVLVRDFIQGRFGLINGAVIPCYHHSDLFYRTAFIERIGRRS